MDVRSNFFFTPRNAAGNIQNGIAVMDEATNAPQVITAEENMNAMDLGNRSANFLQVTVDLIDDQGGTSQDTVFMFPGSSESWNFEGRFIAAVSIVAVDEPAATAQNANGLTVAAAAAPGLVDVNLIET